MLVEFYDVIYSQRANHPDGGQVLLAVAYIGAGYD